MDLLFQTNNGNSFYIEIGYFDTVLEIKEKVQKYHHIPVSKQTLIFNGDILSDDLNVHYSDILDRSRINLVIASDLTTKTDKDFPKLRLLLKMPASTLLTVEVNVHDTIRRLKEKIHELERSPVGRQVIYANGKELPDHKSMRECELSENSDITVALRPSPGNMGVVVQYGVEKIPAEVTAAENVGELRKKLQTVNLNLPKEGYFFTYKQNAMDDDRSFRWHHVGEGDTIEIFSGRVSRGS